MNPTNDRSRAPLAAMLAAATLLTLLTVNVVTLGRINSARPLVVHTQEVQSTLTRIRAFLVDAETGQRGYLLTGDASYLEPFTSAVESLPASLDHAKQLMAEDRSQQQRRDELERVVRRKMEELRRTIDLYRAGDLAAALAIVRGNEGKSAMDEARRIIEALRTEESRLLERRTAAVRRSLRAAIWIDVGAGVALVALALLLFVIDRDIARRRELEQKLREAAQLQERFVAILAHDLRNPLSAIAVASGVLQRHPGLSPDASSTVRRISATVARMGRMVDQLLDVARARLAGGIPVQRKPGIELADVARDAIDELRLAHPQARISLRADPEIRGSWDGDRIAQVVSNLAANAIQHGAGSPIEVRVHRRDGAAILEVRNGGPAIHEDLLPFIFDPFRRGGEHSVPAAHGLGLGLYITHQIVLAHGGSIDVRSTQAEGTQFLVTLPC